MLPLVARTAPRILDRVEQSYLRWSRAQLQRRFRDLARLVPTILLLGHVQTGFTVPGAHEYDQSFRTWLQGVYADGFQSGHHEVGLLRRAERVHTYDDTPDSIDQLVTGTSVKPVLPADAVKWVQNRQVLQGKWSRDLDSQVSQVLADSLQRGRSTTQVMDLLRGVFVGFSNARLENIARTESTAAFNAGRLGAFRQSGGYVVAVQFVAILDARTTQTCKSRNGLIMELDDKRLGDNTPPLHYQCRSVLSPISRIEWRKLQDGDPRAVKRAFGYLQADDDFSPPGSLREALDGWEDAHPAMEGFGGSGVSRYSPQDLLSHSRHLRRFADALGLSVDDLRQRLEDGLRDGAQFSGSPIVTT